MEPLILEANGNFITERAKIRGVVGVIAAFPVLNPRPAEERSYKDQGPTESEITSTSKRN